MPTPPFDDFIRLRFSADGHLLTRVFSQRLGALLAWIAARAGLKPNTVTSLALLSSLAGAATYACLPPGFYAILVCVALTQLGYALDCADGQLARATGSSSRLGAWLDVYCDYLVILAISVALLQRLLMADSSQEWSLLCILLFTFGRVGSLYSSTMARIWRSGEVAATGIQKNWMRKWAVLLIDTPVTLLLICLLRNHPPHLMAFLLISGGLHVLHGTYVGVTAATEQRTS